MRTGLLVVLWLLAVFLVGRALWRLVPQRHRCRVFGHRWCLVYTGLMGRRRTRQECARCGVASAAQLRVVR